MQMFMLKTKILKAKHCNAIKLITSCDIAILI